MWPWLMVALGGALGALARYAMAGYLVRNTDYSLPLGTLSVNVLGSLLMGLGYVLIVERGLVPLEWRPLLLIGLLGAFTTFSTFSLESLALLEQGHISAALIYISLSVIVCIGAAWAGTALARIIF